VEEESVNRVVLFISVLWLFLPRCSYAAKMPASPIPHHQLCGELVLGANNDWQYNTRLGTSIDVRVLRPYQPHQVGFTYPVTGARLALGGGYAAVFYPNTQKDSIYIYHAHTLGYRFGPQANQSVFQEVSTGGVIRAAAFGYDRILYAIVDSPKGEAELQTYWIPPGNNNATWCKAYDPEFPINLSQFTKKINVNSIQIFQTRNEPHRFTYLALNTQNAVHLLKLGNDFTPTLIGSQTEAPFSTVVYGHATSAFIEGTKVHTDKITRPRLLFAAGFREGRLTLSEINDDETLAPLGEVRMAAFNGSWKGISGQEVIVPDEKQSRQYVLLTASESRVEVATWRDGQLLNGGGFYYSPLYPIENFVPLNYRPYGIGGWNATPTYAPACLSYAEGTNPISIHWDSTTQRYQPLVEPGYQYPVLILPAPVTQIPTP
jgi:hypothetical protein